MKQQSLRLNYLDGIRGLAALYVAIHHVWQFAIATPDDGAAPGWFRVMSVFKYGTYGVAVFIVVSGYCLMLPVARGDGTLNGGFRGFAQRRARRILPPYFAALALSLLLILAFTALREPSGGPWDITRPSLTVGSVVSHVFLVHNLSEQSHWTINPPLWSVALEFQIYFLFALVLLPVWRRGGWRTAGSVAASLAFLLIIIGAGHTSPWMIGLFALGMAGATINFRGSERLTHAPWLAFAALAVVAVPPVTALAARMAPQPWEAAVQESFAGLAMGLGLVALSGARLSGGPGGQIATLLERGPLQALGRISYSVYLVHYPLVALASILVVNDLSLGAPMAFLVIAALSLPLVALASWASYTLLERRFVSGAAPTPLGANRHAPMSLNSGLADGRMRLTPRVLPPRAGGPSRRRVTAPNSTTSSQWNRARNHSPRKSNPWQP